MKTGAKHQHHDQSENSFEGPTLHCTAAYAESDKEKLLAFIESTVLGSIITSTAAEGILVNQIPFTLTRNANPAAAVGGDESVFGTLQCHFPRQNEAQLRAIMQNPKQQIVVVFNGPNHYISANWFPSKRRTHKFVPTWNYATVNVTARVRHITESGPNFMKDATTLDACSDESADSFEKNKNGDAADCERTDAQVRNATHRAFLRDHLDRLSAVCEDLVGEERPWMLSDAPVSFLDGLYTQLVGIELDVLRIDGKIKAVQNKPTEVEGVVRGLQRLLDEGEARYGQNGTNATSSMCPLGTLRLAKDGGLLHSNTKSSEIKLKTASQSKKGEGEWCFALPTSLINSVLIACLAAIFAAFALQRETA